jgi:hypothetical protein
MLGKSEQEQLDKAWSVIRIIWGALVGSLAIYVLVCKLAEDQLQPISSGFSSEALKNIFYFVSAIVLVGIFLIRKAMLAASSSSAAFTLGHASSIQHPAAIQYMFATIVAMALCETIGIFGVVLFFLSKDSFALYQFIMISAAAMFFYRPRKEEFLQLAEDMKKQKAGRRI